MGGAGVISLGEMALSSYLKAAAAVLTTPVEFFYFKPHVDVSIEDVKRVRDMLCEYILKETIDRKGNFYSGAP
jgi:hypothetical protein